jgi:hypothetical protein
MIILRSLLPSDLSSYTLALCTDMPRARFLLITTAGLSLTSLGYALFGSLPFLIQFAASALSFVLALRVCVCAERGKGPASQSATRCFDLVINDHFLFIPSRRRIIANET